MALIDIQCMKQTKQLTRDMSWYEMLFNTTWTMNCWKYQDFKRSTHKIPQLCFFLSLPPTHTHTVSHSFPFKPEGIPFTFRDNVCCTAIVFPHSAPAYTTQLWIPLTHVKWSRCRHSNKFLTPSTGDTCYCTCISNNHAVCVPAGGKGIHHYMANGLS